METKHHYVSPENRIIPIDEESPICFAGSGTNENYNETDYDWGD